MAETPLPEQHNRRGFTCGFALLAGLLIPLLMCGVSIVSLTAHDLEGDTTRLEAALPIMEKYQVQSLRIRDSCKSINYNRGRFASNSDPFCNLGNSQLFDKQAQQDLEIITKAIASTGINTNRMRGRYDTSGRIEYLDFSIDCLGCSKECFFGCRTSYTYAPMYNSLPGQAPNKLWYEYIKDDWYLWVED